MSFQTIAKKYIDMLPKSADGKSCPMPNFVVANALTARWNGIAVWDGKSENCVVKIQKRITHDERTLNRIIAHEICHAWAYWMVWLGVEKAPWHRGHTPDGGWAAAAELINIREGDDFVTEESDESYAVANDKQFFVFLTLGRSGKPAWAWFSRLTENTIKALDRRMWYAMYHAIPMALFKTSDSRFLLPGAKLPTLASYQQTPIGFDDVLDACLKAYRVTGAQYESSDSGSRPFLRSAPVQPMRSVTSRRTLRLTRS